MGMDGARQVFGGAAELHRHHGFGDHRAGVRPDDVDARSRPGSRAARRRPPSCRAAPPGSPPGSRRFRRRSRSRRNYRSLKAPSCATDGALAASIDQAACYCRGGKISHRQRYRRTAKRNHARRLKKRDRRGVSHRRLARSARLTLLLPGGTNRLGPGCVGRLCLLTVRMGQSARAARLRFLELGGAVDLPALCRRPRHASLLLRHRQAPHQPPRRNARQASPLPHPTGCASTSAPISAALNSWPTASSTGRRRWRRCSRW